MFGDPNVYIEGLIELNLLLAGVWPQGYALAPKMKRHALVPLADLEKASKDEPQEDEKPQFQASDLDWLINQDRVGFHTASCFISVGK